MQVHNFGTAKLVQFAIAQLVLQGCFAMDVSLVSWPLGLELGLLEMVLHVDRAEHG